MFREWTDVLSQFQPISKRMIVLLCHSVTLREKDGDFHWETLKHIFNGFHEQITSWTFDDWNHCLMNGTIRIRVVYCLVRNCWIRSIRSVLGHSRGVLIGPKLQKNAQTSYGWTDYISRVGSVLDCSLPSKGRLIAGGIGVQQGRQRASSPPWIR